MRCSQCGTSNWFAGKECTYCGADKSNDQAEQFLGFFFGIMGAVAGWLIQGTTTLLMGFLIGFVIGSVIAQIVNRANQ